LVRGDDRPCSHNRYLVLNFLKWTSSVIHGW
jgi:hypothetical protein